jgi:ferredoxin-NADP reductase
MPTVSPRKNEVPETMSDKLNGLRQQMRVIGKGVAAEGVVMLRLAEINNHVLPAWSPGSHIDLDLTDGMTRQYSLCGSSGDPYLTVAVLREPNGRGGSQYIHDELRVGDVIAVGEPRNNFEFREAHEYLLVAGGIGITPLIPMIEQAERWHKPWRLLYGGRTRASMAFADVLRAQHPDRVAIRPQDQYGLLDLAEAVDKLAIGGAVYCCGPEPLLMAIEASCAQRPDVSLHVERFVPKSFDDDDAQEGFDVELARSEITVRVDPGQSILDALLIAGVEAKFSCREGTCGTCEVAVWAGVPRHRDSVLTEDERAANDAMMICVSRSRTAKLVIDL